MFRASAVIFLSFISFDKLGENVSYVEERAILFFNIIIQSVRVCMYVGG